MITRKISLLLLTMTSAGVFSVQAAVLPDAGETSRQLQKQTPPLQIRSNRPDIQIEEKNATAQTERDNTLIPVQSFQITGNSLFSSDDLLMLVNDLKGGSYTLTQLKEGVARITDFYHKNGYSVARAYLPAQDIQNGQVTISVLEGRVGQVHINNQARISNQRAEQYLNGIQPNTFVHSEKLDRALLLLSDNAGIGRARATLQPGASVGSSDIMVELQPNNPYSGSVGLDNYGNHYSGQYRLNGQLNVNSPFRLGDQFNFNVLQSNQDLSYARAAWQLPVGSDGLTLGAALAGTHYRLGEEFANLEANGWALISSVTATYPFLRTPTTNVFGVFSFESKRLKDNIDSTGTANDKDLYQANFGLAGQRLDYIGLGGVTSFDTNISLGKLRIKLPNVLANDQSTVRTNGYFARLVATVKRHQQISDRHSFSLQVTGQLASKNLNSSEKFSLGGANGVRAYPEGEGLGDEGILASASWNMRLAKAFQGSVFYDAGVVKINYDPSSLTGGQENHRSLSGAGVGLDANIANVQFKSFVAWQVGGGEAKSAPDHNPRLWTQMTVPF